MRPIPRTRHLLAVLILAAVAAVAGYFATIDDRLDDSQVNIASVAIKRHQPDLFRYDDVLGESNRWRFHAPAFQAMLEMLLVPTDYQDLTLPFRAMAGTVVMIYLCGMYALLYRQCRSWSVSVFVAVLSTAVVKTLGESFWGVGPLDTITPPAIVMAMTPLIILSYLRYERQWRVMLVFAFVGLCGNLHLVTAMNLTIVLLIAYLARQRFALRSWPIALGSAVCALVLALPYLGYYAHLRYAAAPAAEISPDLIQEAFRLGNLALLYPGMLKSLLYWQLLVLALLVPATAVLCRVERFRVRDLDLWVSLAVGSLIVALGLHGVCQLYGSLHNTPPTVAFAQAASFAMLPLYILFGQALTNLFRLVRTHRATLRWVCAAFLVAWMLPSDNLRVVRHWGYETATAFLEDEQKPLRVQELRIKHQERQELLAITQWARSHSPVDSIFVTDEHELRMLARRAIFVAAEDVKYYYYVTPWQLDRWIARVMAQRAATRPPTGQANPEAVRNLEIDSAVEAIEPDVAWYVLLSVSDAPASPGPLEPIVDPAWGKHYRLYRVR